jgi:hypothetical protein
VQANRAVGQKSENDTGDPRRGARRRSHFPRSQLQSQYRAYVHFTAVRRDRPIGRPRLLRCDRGAAQVLISLGLIEVGRNNQRATCRLFNPFPPTIECAFAIALNPDEQNIEQNPDPEMRLVPVH